MSKISYSEQAPQVSGFQRTRLLHVASDLTVVSGRLTDPTDPAECVTVAERLVAWVMEGTDQEAVDLRVTAVTRHCTNLESARLRGKESKPEWPDVETFLTGARKLYGFLHAPRA